MTEIGQPFLFKNRPQTFLSRFLTTKSVLPGEPKVERWPSCTIIQLSRSLTNTKKEISDTGPVSFVISSRSPKKWPKSAKIAKIRLQQLDFLTTYIGNRIFFWVRIASLVQVLRFYMRLTNWKMVTPVGVTPGWSLLSRAFFPSDFEKRKKFFTFQKIWKKFFNFFFVKLKENEKRKL